MTQNIISSEQVEKLRAAGYQIVPIDPDMNMKLASVEVLKYYDESVHSFDIAGWHAIWPAMLKAAPVN